MNNQEDSLLQETRTLLLEYLEGHLPDDEKARVEQLLEESAQAARELEELKEMMAVLNEKRAVFCPAPWKISDFVETGADPAGEISQHLSECASCRAEEEAFRSALRTGSMPPDLWLRIKREFDASRDAKASGRSKVLPFVVDYLRPCWGIRGLAVGAAVAAVLIVTVLYPLWTGSPKVGLSSVVWNGNGSSLTGSVLSAAPQQKETVAIILFFKDFSNPPPQATIDSLYKALRPKPKQRERFNVVSPADLKKVITAAKVDPSQERQVLAAVRTELGLKKVVLVDLSPFAEGFKVTAELIDTSTGKTVQRLTKEAQNSEELAPLLHDTCYAVLGLDNGSPTVTQP